MTWTRLEQFIDDSPGAVWDETHAQEIINNVGGGITEVIAGSFNGTTGAVIEFLEKSGAYAVVVTALGSAPGDVGEISFERTSTTTATIYNSGSSTGDFVAVVFDGGS
jgi:hypothetical protein